MMARLRFSARIVNGISAGLIFGAYSILCGGVQASKAWAILAACLIVFMPLISWVHDLIERRINPMMVALLDGTLEPTPDVLESARRSILTVPWITACMNFIIACVLIVSAKSLFVVSQALGNARFDPQIAGFAAMPAIMTLTLLAVHNACQPYRTTLFVGVDMSEFKSTLVLNVSKRFGLCIFLALWSIVLCAVFVMQISEYATPQTINGALLSFLLCYCSVSTLSVVAASILALKRDPLEAPSSRNPDAVGDLNPAYEIIEELGRGGMGVIYKARHRLWDSLVTVKMLNPNLIGSMESLQRFRLEARAASKLNHENVVSVLDFGVLPGGRCYMVMELVDGAALDALIDITGPMHYTEAIPVFRQICLALEHAHKAGVLHRDLKPGNVMVTGAHPPKAKLLDFGIAKLIDDPQAVKLTRTGEVFGTPSYMSPEQCSGGALDARSDMYSMGCLMYEVLSGSRPYLANSSAEVMYMHLNQEIPELPNEVEIPAQLKTIVRRCLAKEKEQRFGSLQELADELAKIPCTALTGVTDA